MRAPHHAEGEPSPPEAASPPAPHGDREPSPPPPAADEASPPPAVRHALWVLGLPGCGACRVAAEAEARHLRWFLVENYGSLPAIVALDSRARFCPSHAGALLALAPACLSVPLLSLAQSEAARLEAWRRGLAERPGAPRPCPACAAGQTAAEVLLYQVRDALQWDAARVAPATAGLCRSHLLSGLRTFGRGLAAPVRQAHLRRLGARRARGGSAGLDVLLAFLWGRAALPPCPVFPGGPEAWGLGPPPPPPAAGAQGRRAAGP